MKWYQWLIVLVALSNVIKACGWDQPSPSSGYSEKTPGGRTKGQWIQRCAAYAEARNQCAVAANVTQCAEIKIGEAAAYMAALYCDGDTPNWNMMGAK